MATPASAELFDQRSVSVAKAQTLCQMGYKSHGVEEFVDDNSLWCGPCTFCRKRWDKIKYTVRVVCYSGFSNEVLFGSGSGRDVDFREVYNSCIAQGCPIIDCTPGHGTAFGNLSVDKVFGAGTTKTKPHELTDTTQHAGLTVMSMQVNSTRVSPEEAALVSGVQWPWLRLRLGRSINIDSLPRKEWSGF